MNKKASKNEPVVAHRFDSLLVIAVVTVVCVAVVAVLCAYAFNGESVDPVGQVVSIEVERPYYSYQIQWLDAGDMPELTGVTAWYRELNVEQRFMIGENVTWSELQGYFD